MNWRGTMRFVVLAATLAVLRCHGADWVDTFEVKLAKGNLTWPLVWHTDQGLRLRLHHADSGTAVEVHLDRAAAAATVLRPDEKPQALLDASFNPEALPGGDREQVEVVIKFRPTAWSIYLDSRRVARLPIVFLPPLAVLQQQPALTPPRFQKVGDYRLHADFMAADDELENLAPFAAVSGEWRRRSALEDAIDQASSDRLSARPLQAELSSNFYSLQGQGSAAKIVVGNDFLDQYRLAAATLTHPGKFGLLFHYRGPDSFFAWTIEMPEDASKPSVLRLLRQTPKAALVLDSVTVQLARNEWVRPEVSVDDGGVRCLLDDQELIDYRMTMPVAGRVGLTVSAEAPIRFDDFEVISNNDLDLTTQQKMRFHRAVEHGAFFPRGPFGLAAPADGGTLTPPQSMEDQWLVLGSPATEPHVFQATFDAESVAAHFGLIVGYQGEMIPHLRFECRHSASAEEILLYKVLGTIERPLDSCRFPRDASIKTPGRKSYKLVADSSEPGQTRFYRNDQLLLVYHWPEPLHGASGIWVGAQTKVTVSEVRQRDVRPQYHTLEEKNRAFATDPFMRHWSSPEGLWFQKDEQMWLKSDLFGRFELKLPLVAAGKVFLGVPEDQDSGPLAIVISPARVALVGLGESETELAAAELPPVPPPPEGEASTEPPPGLAIHYEDHVLWLTLADNVLLKRFLQVPLRGRRLRLEGFTVGDLHASDLRRHQVKDYLFNRAPSDWVTSGGRWQIINRFQCDPRWSHLNGESGDGFAGMWTKYEFAGDFCVEVYAGMRHGWYARCGDINLTLMNRNMSPSSGFTVTTTGWDFDHSQLWTRLYKDGQRIAESDAYLIPRVRDGNQRQNRDPLIPPDRPVHGAWYYFKIRRSGDRLQYFFDNELVFDETATDPREGMMGLWTFMNSVMVARVQIAADEIRPRRFDFTRMPPSMSPPDPRAEALTARYARLLNHELPADFCQPSLWQAADPVGQPALSWVPDSATAPYLVFRSVLGSGTMDLDCTLPPLPYAQVAGFRFEIQRTPRTQFNFQYSIGRLNEGEFVPLQRYFHQLEGTDFSDGPLRRSGHTAIPASEAADGQLSRDGPWTRVNVWLPVRDYDVADPTLMVKIDGFGNRQPSYEKQGLHGNAPGSAYAVRQFAPVFTRPPVLTLTGSTATGHWLVLDGERRETLLEAKTFTEVHSWLSDNQQTGLVDLWLRLVGPDNLVSTQMLTWIRLPEEPQIACGWDQTAPATIRLTSGAPYPEPRLLTASARIGDLPLALQPDGFNTLRAPLPRVAWPDDTAVITLTSAGAPRELSLSWTAAPGPVNEAPVLQSAEFDPWYQNFESRQIGRPVVSNALTQLRDYDPQQGTYLAVQNREVESRLITDLAVGESLAQYPLLQFRYRIDRMAQITMALQETSLIALSESRQPAAPVRHAPPALLFDQGWQTWLGFISDGIGQRPFTPQRFVPRTIRFGSQHRTSQTGRYSYLHLDDVVLGRAVSQRAQLAFTPHYFDHDGVQQVLMCISPSAVPYAQLPPEHVAAALTWQEIANDQRTMPVLDGLGPGVAHLLLKATDTTGLTSAVTDVPFLFDTEPIVAAYNIEALAHPAGNGSALRVQFQIHGASPLQLRSLIYKLDSRVMQLTDYLTEFIHSAHTDTLLINWPYHFRERLDAMADGETTTFTISNIIDGAGNRTADVVVPVTIEYAKDKTGPSWLAAKVGSPVLWRTQWEGEVEPTDFFTSGTHNVTNIIHVRGHAPYLQTLSHDVNGDLSRAVDWDLSAYSWFACRLRQPTLKPDMTMDLLLTLKDGTILEVPLDAPREGKLNLPKPIKWATDTWHSVMLDVPAAIKAQLPALWHDHLRVQNIGIRRRGCSGKQPLHLRDLFIMRPWQASDQVELAAYDASGVAGLTYFVSSDTGHLSGETQVAGMTFSPLAAGQLIADGWLTVTARDKAGNASVPLHLPYPDAR